MCTCLMSRCHDVTMSLFDVALSESGLKSYTGADACHGLK